MAPTLVASRTALPPEGALRLRPGKAGSAAPADIKPPISTPGDSRPLLPPQGALRLRPGKAGSAAPADIKPPISTPGDSRPLFPPQGALRLRPGKAGSAAPADIKPPISTPGDSRPLLPPQGALRLRPDKAGSAVCAGSTPQDCALVKSRLPHRSSQIRGFTLIELLVALAAMGLMAGLSWRGLDGMVRAQSQIAQRADAVLTLQAGLLQWNADLDALLELPHTPTLDWDGRGLRIVRRSTVQPGDGALVVAWARRNINGTDYWLRWQSAPQFSRGELKAAWAQAAQWAQNPGDAEKRAEVRITPLAQWQVFYFRGNAWTNPLSSGNATMPPPQPIPNPSPTPGSNPEAPPVEATVPPLPDGVRLVLTLPVGEAISGVLTRDWARPALGGAKS